MERFRGRANPVCFWKFLLCVVVFSLMLTQISICEHTGDDRESDSSHSNLKPRIIVAFLVRNKAHILPYFLYHLQNLSYPKDRMALWIRSDHNIDNSVLILKEWISRVKDNYHYIDYHADESSTSYSDEQGPCDWSTQRFGHIIHLRQMALQAARLTWADYLFFVDVDNILLNTQVLNELIAEKKPVIAPMLNATASTHYSNFWCGMDENGYYRRTPDYKLILQRHIQGVHEVPMIHSMLLIDLQDKSTQNLAYHPPPPGYQGAVDDIILFAASARYHNVPLYLMNKDFYGYMLIPMETLNTLSEEGQQFAHMKAEAVVWDLPLEKLPYIQDTPVPKSKLGFDQIYMINLLRRPERREKMLQIFDILGIEAVVVDAVDGQQLNETFLDELGVRMLPGYSDPYHHRPLTRGEIGCFLSHYNIWAEVLEKRYEKIIVFEDDARVEPYFKERLAYLIHEVTKVKLNWDLIYLGRKKLNYQKEYYVEECNTVVWPHYSYWTLSYALSFSGAKKLIDQNPLQKMLPVDEYLPIMFNVHPEDGWKSHFQPRDLVGVSAEPLLVQPTLYTGEPGYFTDTENSEIVNLPPSTTPHKTIVRVKGDEGEFDSEDNAESKDEL